MHFLLSSMSVVYVLTTPIPEYGENATVVQIGRRNKKELWDSLEAKYMAKDASSKKFFVNFKHTLKHNKEELTFVELGSHLRIEESLRAQESDKPKGNNVASPYNQMFRLNIVNDNIASVFMSTSKVNDSIIWHARLGHVHYKRMQDMSKDGLIPAFDMDTEKLIYDEAFDIFKVFKTEVELQQGSQIKIFRTDRGGEYMDTLYFQSVDIIHETTAPYTLQQNGIFERKNKDSIFDENRFSSVSRPSQRVLINKTGDIGGLVVPEEVTEEDIAFWKEAINDEMNFILGNNTWVLTDLPPGCKSLGCKWIIKIKLKVDGTIKKFRAIVVIQGFRQSGIDYFDTYAPVVRISTIRQLIAMASIRNLIIHSIDVKTAFLNGELDEEVYMNQHEGFIMPSNENKVLSSGYLLNQADKCVYRKFDETGKGFIICLYVDDMLIFCTDKVQVDLKKEFLSSKFSMKDMRPDIAFAVVN
ncbi:zinc finger, CCHC-type containing protein [Tanacetum coccineum]